MQSSAPIFELAARHADAIRDLQAVMKREIKAVVTDDENSKVLLAEPVTTEDRSVVAALGWLVVESTVLSTNVSTH